MGMAVGVSVGFGSRTWTSAGGVLVGSGAAVTVGVGLAVGVGVAGTGVGVCGSMSASQANVKKSVANVAAMMATPMVVSFEFFTGCASRWVVSGGHCLERILSGCEGVVDMLFFDPSHMPYTEDLACEFTLSAA